MSVSGTDGGSWGIGRQQKSGWEYFFRVHIANNNNDILVRFRITWSFTVQSCRYSSALWIANSGSPKILYIRNVAREALMQHSSFLILTLTPQTLFLIDSGVETEYKPASYVPCGKLRCTNHMRCASSTPKYMVIWGYAERILVASSSALWVM